MSKSQILNKSWLCETSSTLVCVAIGCVAAIVIWTTLNYFGLVGATKSLYNRAKGGAQNLYDVSSKAYRSGMSSVARAPQNLFGRRKQSAQNVNANPVPAQRNSVRQMENYYYEEAPQNETFNQFNSYGCMENFENEDAEYADNLTPPPIQASGSEQRIYEELGGIRKEIGEIKKNCPGTKKEGYENYEAENYENYDAENYEEENYEREGFEGGNQSYFDDNAAENFGNLSVSETKNFGEGVVCQQGTTDEQNITNPMGALMLEGGSRCKNANGVYDEIIGDMHPYYLNEIAARGEGNELIAATVRQPHRQNSRSFMDEGKFYSQGQYFD